MRARAAADLGCPEGKLTVESRELHGFEVTGCGKRASYVLRGGEVLSDTGGELPGMRDLHED